MMAEHKEKPWDGVTERRKKKEPRRRLVDLTLAPGTDRREGEKDRRKGDVRPPARNEAEAD